MNAPFNETAATIKAAIVSIAIHFRGEPNRALSDKTAMRWGSHGSFQVGLSGQFAGRWHDWERQHGGDALDLIREELGCDLADALCWARSNLGMGNPCGDARFSDRSEISRGREIFPTSGQDDAARLARVHDLLAGTRDPRGTVVEDYLSRRLIHLDDDLCGTIRFHPAMPWKDDEGHRITVAGMVCEMRDIRTDEVRACHRTALRSDGSKIGRKMLGKAGGGVIKLDADETVTMGLGLAEGVETALTVRQHGFRPMWAAASAGAIRAFPTLAGLEALTIFADHDEAGLEAARACAERWREAGTEAEVFAPPRPGTDFNDGGRG